MRITNSMMVSSTKININGNKTGVDRLNRQLASQKKIIKPSDDPIIAIRSLRLRSSLSTIDQYYERNIPDTESWMDVTETALVNIKDIVSKCYEQVVYGATDELNNENRLTIQKELKALQEQVYTEGNADYAGRTVFTGYKTNHQLTFTDSADAAKSNYSITEHLSYQNVESNKYYVNQIKDTTTTTLLDPSPVNILQPQEYDIKRLRLSYDNMNKNDAMVTLKYPAQRQITVTDPVTNTSSTETVNVDVAVGFGTDAAGSQQIVLGDHTFTLANGATQPTVEPDDLTLGGTGGTTYTVVDSETGATLGGVSWGSGGLELSIGDGTSFTFRSGSTSEAQAVYQSLSTSTNQEVFLDYEKGELLLSPAMSDMLESKRADIEVSYNKKGFDIGEVRPENFFDCVNNTDPDHPITYQNYDENGDWIVEGIYYNIANKQAMQINTEARDVFDANIYRDMDELIDIVNMAIDSQNAVDSIKQKLDSGLYAQGTPDYIRLSGWLDAANKQLDYAVQNMHDRFSSSITTFQGYLDKVTLAVTDAGSRGERVALTKTRMSVQQTTFEELQSINEDAELSELMIDYSAAYVSYQAALQAAGKIGRMTLLDYI